MQYDDLQSRLQPEALNLFSSMAVAHLASEGDRFFILSRTLAGARLHFTGKAPFSAQDLDPGTLDDLTSYGLLRKEYGRRDPNYRVTNEGLLFHGWHMDQKGEPIAQVEEKVMRFLEGNRFASLHPSASHHLREAFSLLWTADMSEASLSEIGDHLRKAIFDVVDDVVPRESEDSPRREKPVDRLKDWMANSGGLGEREKALMSALVELVNVSLRLDHRLAHVRDESDEDVPIRSWDEARRAAFATAFLCYELSMFGEQR